MADPLFSLAQVAVFAGVWVVMHVKDKKGSVERKGERKGWFARKVVEPMTKADGFMSLGERIVAIGIALLTPVLGIR